MAKVFISYRREDSADASGRIFDRLASAFGRDEIFMDVDTIPLGADFRHQLKWAVQECDIVLAVIGRRWLTIEGKPGRRRLANSQDLVRIEIELAIAQKRHLIPVLVQGASMPDANSLPDSMRPLAFRNAAEIRSGAHFEHDVRRLIENIRRWSKKSATRSRPNRPDPDTKVGAAVPRETPSQTRPNRRSLSPRVIVGLLVAISLILAVSLFATLGPWGDGPSPPIPPDPIPNGGEPGVVGPPILDPENFATIELPETESPGPGMMLWAGFDFAPVGWMKCEGQELSESVNQRLHVVIGQTYGGSDGTFKLPDVRGRRLIGIGNGTTSEFGKNGIDAHTAIEGNVGFLSLNSIINIDGNCSLTTPIIGTIVPAAMSFAPRGWALCDGQVLPISQNTALFSLLGTKFGGDGRTTMQLPDLRSRIPIGAGQGDNLPNFAIGQVGLLADDGDESRGHLPINYMIAVQGVFPSSPDAAVATTAGNQTGDEAHIGQIVAYAGTTVPSEWLPCDGQLLPIPQHDSLFSLLGTIYGGDGRTTFGLPNLRRLSALHAGAGPGLQARRLGASFAESTSADGEIEIGYLTVNHIICVEGTYPARN